LRAVASAAEAGMPWCASLHQSGLISPADAAVLSAAERVGNLPWALEEMAASALRRQAYRVQALIHILYLFLLILAGVMVFLFVAGLFVPLVTLIQGMVQAAT
jgi:type II secretory pathway component PulF